MLPQSDDNSKRFRQGFDALDICLEKEASLLTMCHFPSTGSFFLQRKYVSKNGLLEIYHSLMHKESDSKSFEIYILS